MKLINADELELDTEWSEYYDGFTSYSQSQIDAAEEVKAIPLEKIKQARKEMDDLASHKVRPISFEQAVAIDMCIKILDKLIEEVEDGSKKDN